MPSGVHPSATRPQPAGAPSATRPRLTSLLLGLLPALSLGACAADPPPTDPAPMASGDPAPAGVDAARDQLAALAATAQDRHLVARYALGVAGRADRSVTITNATDGTWRVDVADWALGGTTDISVARTADGLYQCGLPSAERPEAASCVRVGAPTDTLPHRLDPRVQHPFTDWLDVLTDRQSPISVSVSRPLPGATGTCFSVESTSASLNAPLDVGIYCYQADGTLTAARTAFGTLRLAEQPTAPPATVALAGPVVDREPIGVAAPPGTEHSPNPDDSSTPEEPGAGAPTTTP